MDRRKLWDLTPTEAEAFLAGYIAAAPAKIAWFEELVGRPFDASIAGLVDVWVTTIKWWDERGDEPPAVPLPMWCRGELSRWLAAPLSPMALHVADAVGYVYGRALLADEPRLRWRRYDGQDIGVNSPILDAGADVHTTPFKVGHVAMLSLDENSGPFGHTRAARDPEYLSADAAYFLNLARTNGDL